ncbi:M20 family metallopeptidase [Streptomyces sp. NBC_01016]|uniref:M20 family metallopeptidase n=1 Tax=Streptomyces sp. NBC_01016 TaxID=2903720 RepID=UPI0022508F5A|nr:M20 family metallopeptidase [Streptomyces sp. NBC_01016]MCX4832263.1 M20 family metallopeptidase [Streptomyces sp. NBC_01016]
MSQTHTVAEGDRLKKDTSAGVSTWEGQVLSLARSLHARPELSFEETESAAAITALLAEGGLAVEHGTGGLPTAFTATAGSGDLTVALCVEYDALPGVGHACGHNLIAGASVAAALALAPHADELGITLKAIGTPAEEHGGGKSLLLEAGAFDGVGLALMVHPVQDGVSYNPAGTTAQAVGRYRAVFSGRAAHAAAAPHQGVNAADGATIAQVAIGLLRQQIPGDHRVALFVSEAGVATNIIPERAVVDFECRAFTLPEYEALLARVRRCFEGAALASGTEVVIEATEPLYEPLVQDDALAGYWTAAMESFGRDTTSTGRLGGGSTDMGNVSQVIPSLHPWLSIPGAEVPIHSHGFTAVADTDAAYELMLEAARALAWTVVDAAGDPEQRARFEGAAYHRDIRRAG